MKCIEINDTTWSVLFPSVFALRWDSCKAACACVCLFMVQVELTAGTGRKTRFNILQGLKKSLPKTHRALKEHTHTHTRLNYMWSLVHHHSPRLKIHTHPHKHIVITVHTRTGHCHTHMHTNIYHNIKICLLHIVQSFNSTFPPHLTYCLVFLFV